MRMMVRTCVALMVGLSVCWGLRDELLFSAVVARHGARHMLFRKFLNLTEPPSTEVGTLTNVGKHQMYLLGRQLAHEYITANVLLSPRYTPRQISVRAAGLNRTVESALSFAAGLYLPGLGPALNTVRMEKAKPPIEVEEIDKLRKELRDAALPHFLRPIPVRTGSSHHDYLFEAHLRCNSFHEEEKRYERVLKKMNKKHQPFLDLLQEQFGYSDWTTDEVYKFYDSIVSVEGTGRHVKMPVPEEIREKLANVTIENNMEYYLKSALKSKLVAHVVLADVRDHFKRAVESSVRREPRENATRMAVFAVSDTHINAIHRIFGWEQTVPVPFASSLVFELHKLEDVYGNEMYTVYAKYNGEERSLKELDLAVFDKFHAFLKANTFRNETDFMENCLIGEDDTYDRGTFFALGVVLFMTFLSLFGSNWFYLVKKQRETAREIEEMKVKATLSSPINDQPSPYP